MKLFPSALPAVLLLLGTWTIPMRVAVASHHLSSIPLKTNACPTRVICTKHAHFNGPTGVAVDSRGNLYVADVNSARVDKLAPDGRLLNTVGQYPLKTKAPEFPFSVAIDSHDNLYVAVSTSEFHDGPYHGRVQMFSPAGQLLADFVTSPSSLQHLQSALFPGVNARGDVFVADVAAHSIHRFAPTGQPLNAWYVPVRPFGLAVDPTGNVYVSLPQSNRIIKYGPTGKTLRTISVSMPAALLVDKQGSLYAVNEADMRIEKFSSIGKPLARWGHPGSRPGRFDFCSNGGRPTGMGLDVAGNIYVSEKCNARVQKFSPTGKLLRVFR
jgi:sugar lactone lactonase YvrE